MKYRWLLFDADGTILDYDAAEAHSLNSAMGFFSLEMTPAILELYRKINSALWAELERGRIDPETLWVKRFQILASRMNWDLPAQHLSVRYLAELRRSGFLMSGAREMLDSLPETVKKAVISNGFREIQLGRLKQARLNGVFQHLIVSEDAKAAKPSPRFFDYTLKRINFYNRDEILIIGDSLSSDVAGGAGYGIDTCWFNPESRNNPTAIIPTYVIPDWAGLFPILEE